MKSNLAFVLSSALLLIPAIALANSSGSGLIADNAAADRFGVERYSNSDIHSWAFTFDGIAAQEFPTAIYDRIATRISLAPTFIQVGSDRMVRWAPRSLQLIGFIRTRPSADANTYRYVLRYAVAVSNDAESDAVYDSSCQVMIVSKDGGWNEPTIVCEPLQRSRTKHMS